MKVLLFGATGMVGSCVLAHCLKDPRIDGVLSVSRRSTGIEHGKLREVIHADYLDFTTLKPQFTGIDLCIYCLAVYQYQVSAREYEVITVDYLRALIEALEEVNPTLTFCLFSAGGARPDGGGLFSFARVKGRAENALTESALKSHYIFRPGYIMPAPERRKWFMSYRVIEMVFTILPASGLKATDMAAMMVNAGITRPDRHLFENTHMRQYIRDERT